MAIREANVADIQQIQFVRNSVVENKLSNPNLISDADCAYFLTVKGKGWVCEMENAIVGFSIVDLLDHNIWALFLNPAYEKQGIGRQLHEVMLDWYFTQTMEKVWLSTDPNTRAERFYREAGWREVGKHGKDEIKFEMTYDDWRMRIQ